MKVVKNNPLGKECIAHFTKEKLEEINNTPYENLWGGGLRVLSPSKLVAAWLYTVDPLMSAAGQGYRATEVRDRAFELQKLALTTIRGNRKLTKAKMGDALSSMKPSVDDTKVIAAILYALKNIQTVCFDNDKKTLWTEPSDYRKWSSSFKTIWIDTKCEQMIDWSAVDAKEPSLGKWLADRDTEGWNIDWPIAEGTFEDIKQRMRERNLTPRCLEPGAKIKKEDWAKSLGKAEAIEHLG